MTKTYLFSIDLEDVRDSLSNGDKFRERVPLMTEAYLNFLKWKSWKCTFFTVGKTAERYPDLLKKIVAEGHEVALHSYSHIPVTKQTREEFSEDLRKNIEAITSVTEIMPIGYRAPIFSLTDEVGWAYEVLAENNIVYSSSIFPAKNPLFGWEEFGKKIKKVNGVTEIPMTIGSFFNREVAFGGGVYFRALPFNRIKKQFSEHDLVTGYFHPYDIDTKQEKFMHPGINSNRFYNFLMYYNRKNVFNRLEKISKTGFNVIRYDKFVEQLSK